LVILAKIYLKGSNFPLRRGEGRGEKMRRGMGEWEKG